MFFNLRCIFSQRRYMIAFLVFLGYVSMYSLRANLSMAVVEMTSNKTVMLENSTLTRRPEFDWNSRDKSLVLSAFAFGYLLTAVGGVLASKFGGATVFGVGITLTAITTCLTPYLVHLDFKLFVASRIIEGIFEAIAFSSVFELWSKWAPPEERSRMVSYSFTGAYVGLAISSPVSGFVTSIWGWPAIFYTTGGVAMIWAMLWLILVKNDPASDNMLSNAERLFLAQRMNITKDVEIVYPWNNILTSAPVWTICIIKLIFSCGYSINLLYLPLYIKDVSSIDMSSIGILSALPQLCTVVSHPLAGYVADYVRNKKILNATQIHKLYICGAFLIGAVLLNVAAFWPNLSSVLVSLSIFGLCSSFADVSYHVNLMDLSPKYSSLLVGVSASFFTIGSILGPLFIGGMVQHHSHSEWSLCFVSFSVIYVFGAVLYFIFGSGEVQWWNDSGFLGAEDRKNAMFLDLRYIFSQRRYMIAFLAFFGYVSMYSLRINVSMAIVEMTSNKTVVLANGTFTKRPEFDWNSKDKSLVLSAFAFGYLFTAVGGVIASKFGGATVFGVGIALTAITTCLTPYLVHLDFKWFVASRIVEGIFEAVAYSSMFELWSKWSPPEECSRLVSFSFTGSYVGLTMSYPVSGFVAGIWGWPAIFYTTGGGALIWAVLWLTLVKNDPASDKRLSNTERLFLAERMNITENVEIVYPWNDILTSVPVWTLFIVELIFSCGYTIILLYLPLYIKDISNVDMSSIGILSALPQLCGVISHPLAGYLADYIRNRRILNATQIHKLYICGAFLIGAILLNVTAFWPNVSSVIVSLSIFGLCFGFADISFQVNGIDLSPKYSSLLIGVSNSFFTIGCILSPLFIGQMVQHHSQSEWSSCYISFGMVYVFGAVLYFMYGSGDVQWWNDSRRFVNENEPN